MSELLPPDCAGPDRYLVDLVYDETASVPEDVREHVDGCVRCLEALAHLRHVRDTMGTLPLEVPSSEMDDRIFAALDAHLAGGDVKSFVSLPDPEFALGAKRLTALLSQSPTSESPRRAAETAKRSSATSPWAGASPDEARARPARRRWPAAFAAAASVAVVAGGAVYLSKESGDAPMMALSSRPAESAKNDASGAGDIPLGLAKASSGPKAVAGERGKDAEKNEKNKDKQAHETCNGLDDDCNGLTDGAMPVEKRGHLSAPMEAKPARPAAVTAQLADGPSKKRAPPAPLQANGGLGGEMASGESAGFMQTKELQTKAVAHAKKATEESRSTPPTPTAAVPVARSAPSDAMDNDSMAPVVAPLPPPPPPVAAPSPSGRMAGDQKGNADGEAADWSAPMSQARAAAHRGDNRAAAAEFALVVATADAPPAIVREALEGRVQALMALNRLDDAQAAADKLAKLFPTVTAARERVRRAKAVAAQPAPAKPAAAAAAPASPPPPNAAPTAIDAK